MCYNHIDAERGRAAVNELYQVRRQRVYRQTADAGFPIPETVLEHMLYTQEVPYCIEYQRYENDAVTRPHYGHTLEVIVSFGVSGDYSIAGRAVPLEADSILFIPPNMLHSGVIRGAENTYLINLKFDFERLRPMVDIERMYSLKGLSVNQLIYCRPDRNETVAAVMALIDHDGDLFLRTAALIKLFGIWADGLEGARGVIPLADEGLERLIAWTEQNYKSRITIDDAARIMHLSRSYFCNYFRQKTGMTYLGYLNRLRIEQAGFMLLSGMTASEACAACGFDDLSYFIQLFRRETGCTTRQFVEKFSAASINVGRRV